MPTRNLKSGMKDRPDQSIATIDHRILAIKTVYTRFSGMDGEGGFILAGAKGSRVMVKDWAKNTQVSF